MSRTTNRALGALVVLLLAVLPTSAQQIIDTVVGTGYPSSASATAAPLGFPTGITVDAAGNTYVYAEALYVLLKIDTGGNVSAIAGTGTFGFSGDGGPAINANLGGIFGIDIDAAGNLFLADRSFRRVRKIDTSGVITTVAGNGAFGFSGDGGPATSARVDPWDVEVDAAGDLFIADRTNNRIRKVNTSGIISTVAGNGAFCFSGDGGPATSASMRRPMGVEVDAAGNLFIADRENCRVRKVNTGGTISTIAGTGSCSFSGDGGLATSARLRFPWDVVADGSGNIFIVDQGNNRIRKVDTSGIITTVAGNGGSGFSGDGGPATSARLGNPLHAAVDGSGNLLISDRNNGRIRQVDAGGTITTVAGSGNFFFGEGIAAADALLRFPTGIDVDGAGNLFIADRSNHRIRKVDAGGTITTVAGTASVGFSGDGGPATSASLNSPWDVVADGSGNVFISDQGNQRIRKVDTSGTITTIAGTGGFGFTGDGGPATGARFRSPTAIELDSSGDLYIADVSNCRIRKVDTSGTISTVAGTGSCSFSGDGGLATSARLSFPRGVAVDASGNLYISDSSNRRIRKVDTSGIITTVAGNGSFGCSSGVAATGTGLGFVNDIEFDSSGNLLLADRGCQRIRQIDTSGIITHVAGSGSFGFSGDGGPATSARLANPFDVAATGSGGFFIADFSNNRIREVGPSNQPPTAVCVDVTVSADGACQASASVDGGSFDKDAGDTITVTETPGPTFGLGTTTVTLTVKDTSGAQDTCTATVTVVDDSSPVTTCPADATLECPADTSVAANGSASGSDNCGVDSVGSSDASVPGCGTTETITRTWTTTDTSANTSSCDQAISVVDTTSPVLTISDTTPITVTDTDCSGDEPASLPTASATDTCDGATAVSNDAQPPFPAGQTTTVTYSTNDACGNPSTDGVDVTVLYGADIAIQANKHTVGSGTYPGSTKEPLVGIEVCAYDKATDQSCSRATCGGISHQHYQCIADSCPAVSCCTTDASGACTINAPPGDYIVISEDATKTTLPSPLGVSASDLLCGELKQKHLQQIVNSKGDKMSAKYKKRTGSELLIIEPDEIVWDETQELYPFVLDAVGNWSETTTVEPPEGFVRDHDYLTENAVDTFEALQFVLTDVGTDWVPMVTRHIVQHNGRLEVVFGEIGTPLEEDFARSKGLDVYGRELAEVGENAPPPVFVTPAAILDGWVEPSEVDADWSFKVEAERDTDLTLTLETLDGTPVRALASGRIPSGSHAFSWTGNLPGSLTLDALQVRIAADGIDKTFRLRLPELQGFYDSLGSDSRQKRGKR